MVTDYASRKKEVLASYDVASKLTADLREKSSKMGMPDPLVRVQPLLTDIQHKVNKVRDDRFTLMIAGESKSGKSTFINAYLGLDILPMDVKQCTSSIIVIKHGDKFHIKATYADGRTTTVSGEKEAREFLRMNAALDDEYRDIPVPTINSEILVKQGVKAKKRNQKIVIPSHEITALLKAPEVQAANIHKLPVKEYNKKIENYITQRKNSWMDIVTKIDVFCPLSDKMKGVEIIDSPGVCARGGVSEITSGYINRADAVMFLKPVSGQALESTEFNQFMQNVSIERSKAALFLVLTRATNVPPMDLKRLEDEAHQQFKDLDSNHILLVDSKAELYAKKFATIEDIQSELRRLNKEGTLDDFVRSAYADSKDLFDEGNDNDFIKALQAKSKFSAVYLALEDFGRKAHYILLAELLMVISSLYEALLIDLNDNVDKLKLKAEDPTELARQIGDIKTELNSIRNKMSNGVLREVRRFQGEEGIIKSTANAQKIGFIEELDAIVAGTEGSFDRIEKIAILKMDAFAELSLQLQRDFIAACDKELVALSDKSSVCYQSIKPNFTEETFEEIRQSTESKAHETYSYSTGWGTFSETHQSSRYVQDRHVELIKNSILTRLDGIVAELIDNLTDFTEEMGKKYNNQLALNAKSKEKEMEAINEAKVSAEENLAYIAIFNQLVERFIVAKAEASKIEGGIRKNV